MLVEEQQIQNSSCQFSVTKYAVPEKVVIAAIYDGNERSTHL